MRVKNYEYSKLIVISCNNKKILTIILKLLSDL